MLATTDDSVNHCTMLRIILDSACVTRNGVRLLDCVSFVLEPGCHTAVLGSNGAGKTTLLRVLRGEMPPDDPLSRLYETESGSQNDPLGLRDRIAMVSGDMQDFYEGPGRHARGRDIVLAGFYDSPLLYEVPTGEMCSRADEALSLMDALDLAETQAGSMSTGQLRRVLMARALAGEPEVLLLDECLDGLDEASRETAMTLLQRAAGHCTLVVAAHRDDDVPGFVEQMLRLSPAGGEGEPRISESEQSFPARHALPEMEYVVRIRGADVVMRGHHVLYGVNFTMLPGETWAVFGENGAGKSTLLQLIVGDVAPYADEGTVERFGGRGTGEDHRRRMAVVSPELHGLFARYPHCRDTVLETVLSGLFGTIGLYETPSAEDEERARGILAMSGLAGLAERRMETLSHGQRRRALLARAVAGDPWLLLLDEPMSGLDAPSRAGMREVLNELASQGLPLLMVSHRQEDLPSAVNRRLTLHEGRIIDTSVIA